MTAIFLWSFGSVLIVSLVSLCGILLLTGNGFFQRGLLYFVAMAAGALLGDVFLHIFPEMSEEPSGMAAAAPLILSGILVSFLIEKFLHWRHCHNEACETHTKPAGTVALLGDAAHNTVDGALIAGSYLISIPLGITTTIGVVLHEIPQEIGDMALLLHSGFSIKRAVLLNLLTAFTAFIGMFVVLWGQQTIPSLSSYILPFTAGNFLYIASSDLIPALHEKKTMKHGFLQTACMLTGIGCMYALLFLE